MCFRRCAATLLINNASNAAFARPLEADHDAVFLDPNAVTMAEVWRRDPKALERALASV